MKDETIALLDITEIMYYRSSSKNKLMNTLAPIVSSSQLFQEKSRTLLSSHILQVSDEKQIDSVAISVIAGW